MSAAEDAPGTSEQDSSHAQSSGSLERPWPWSVANRRTTTLCQEAVCLLRGLSLLWALYGYGRSFWPSVFWRLGVPRPNTRCGAFGYAPAQSWIKGTAPTPLGRMHTRSKRDPPPPNLSSSSGGRLLNTTFLGPLSVLHCPKVDQRGPFPKPEPSLKSAYRDGSRLPGCWRRQGSVGKPADAKKLAAAGAAGAAAFATAVARFLLGGGVARHASTGGGSCGEAAENCIGAESHATP